MRTVIQLALLLSAIAPQALPSQADIDQAAACIRLARDSQNPADYRHAADAATKALASDPENFDAQRYRAMALFGQQDLPAALELASKLNHRAPDDIGIWTLLADIHSAQGNYPEAEKCAQWVLDLRRNSPLGFLAAAKLRAIYGDYEGASEFYSEALTRTPQSDAQERSWLLVQNAKVLLLNKNLSAATLAIHQAELLFPKSLQVLEQKAALATYATAPAQAGNTDRIINPEPTR